MLNDRELDKYAEALLWALKTARKGGTAQKRYHPASI